MNNPPPPSGDTLYNLALSGDMPSSIAAVTLLAQVEARCASLTIHNPGVQGYILARGRRVIHAEARAGEVHLPSGQAGRLLWKGRDALLALAVLGGDTVQIVLRAVAEPERGQVPNVDAALDLVLLDMAVALDNGMCIGAVRCVFEPATKAT